MALLIPRRNSLFFVLLVLGTLASQAMSSRTSPYEASMRGKHERWMARHGRTYKDDAEKEARFKTFRANVEYIESFNRAGNQSYTMGINQFTDLTQDEFRATYTGYIPVSRQNASKTMSFQYESVTEVPSNVDWREKGAISAVKNQYQCGCCAAFSAIAAVEALTMLRTGQLISLSEQQLVDCNTNSESHGCTGGWMHDHFKYMMQNNGISSEQSYPYQGTEGTCDAQKAATIAATISSFQLVPSNSEDALMKAVANQPVSITIDASSMGFKYYRGGIFDAGDCGTGHNHAVTIVGYGTSEDGSMYWLIRNSWGESWGEAGYMKLRRGVQDPQGLCGITKYPSYPTA